MFASAGLAYVRKTFRDTRVGRGAVARTVCASSLLDIIAFSENQWSWRERLLLCMRTRREKLRSCEVGVVGEHYEYTELPYPVFRVLRFTSTEMALFAITILRTR